MNDLSKDVPPTLQNARLLSLVAGPNNSELTPEDRTELEATLNAWPELAKQLQLEREFETRIAKTMQAVPVPSDLKTKIESSLTASQGTGFRKKTYWAMGLAASLLLTFGGVSAYRIANAPTLDLNELIVQADSEADNPRERVENYLGHRFSPESPINLNLMAFVGLDRLQGRDLPMVYLRNGSKNVYAKVFVVTSKDFRVGETLPATMTGFYGHKVEKLRDKDRKDLIYLILYTGDSLNPFLDEYASH